MNRRMHIPSRFGALGVILISLSSWASQDHSAPAHPVADHRENEHTQSSAAPNVLAKPQASPSCGTLKQYWGEVVLLNAERTEVLATERQRPIPCGTWISVHDGSGWAQIISANGSQVTLGAQTFGQWMDADRLVLFKGEAVVSAESAGEMVSVLTANARVRVAQAVAHIQYASTEDLTQVVALKNRVQFENRFQSGSGIWLKEGEGSKLDLKTARTVPDPAFAVSVADLRKRLAKYQLSDELQKQALQAAKSRSERALSFAADTVSGGEGSPHVAPLGEEDGTSGSNPTLELSAGHAPASVGSPVHSQMKTKARSKSNEHAVEKKTKEQKGSEEVLEQLKQIRE